SVPGLARHVGDLGHLLFQSAVSRIACRVGDVLCGASDMATLAVARSARVGCLRRAVSRRGRLVANHFALSRSIVAPGCRRNARATINGDRVHITGVRNFEYRSLNDFTVRWEEREVQLSRLTGVDFFVSYWSGRLVGHTFLSFIFDNALPLTISIETRTAEGVGFNPT